MCVCVCDVHDVSPTKTSIPHNYNQPYISRNMSTRVVTSQLAHNQRLQVSGELSA